ncbi:hypothetical protein IG631_07313 [Alternaria alternata]|nr:hypothetical protein IG631_07313 [Alternaria alternata]
MLFGCIGVSVGRARKGEGVRARSEGVIRKVHRSVVVETRRWRESSQFFSSSSSPRKPKDGCQSCYP